MRELHIQREKEFAALSPDEKAHLSRNKWAKMRKTIPYAPTAEQKAERSRKMREAWVRRKQSQSSSASSRT
jgi:hypothetical protein